MAYLRIDEARSVARSFVARTQKNPWQILMEEARTSLQRGHYDVFLSHSFDDGEAILGIKKIVEAEGLSVYVDWVDDPQLDRTKVTTESASILRRRMRTCSCLVYAYSPSARDSKWMPWELGYFDGYKGEYIWILPLVQSYDSEFSGQEYLGLYPAIENVSALSGRVDLGFSNVGERRVTIPLAEAARGRGVYFKTA
jgi:hypothetical protein